MSTRRSASTRGRSTSTRNTCRPSRPSSASTPPAVENRELVDVLARKVRALTEPEAIASHKLRMANLYENTLSEPEKAAQTYREVLEVDAASLPAMRGLERLYTASSSWPDLVGVLETQLDVRARASASASTC